MVPGLGQGEQTPFPGGMDLEPAGQKHKVWLQTGQGPSRRGPWAPACPPALCPIPVPPQLTPLRVAEEHKVVLVVPTVHLLKAKLVCIALPFQSLAVL